MFYPQGSLGKLGFTGSPGGKGHPGPSGPPGHQGSKGLQGTKVRGKEHIIHTITQQSPNLPKDQ